MADLARRPGSQFQSQAGRRMIFLAAGCIRRIAAEFLLVVEVRIGRPGKYSDRMRSADMPAKGTSTTCVTRAPLRTAGTAESSDQIAEGSRASRGARSGGEIWLSMVLRMGFGTGPTGFAFSLNGGGAACPRPAALWRPASASAARPGSHRPVHAVGRAAGRRVRPGGGLPPPDDRRPSAGHGCAGPWK